jgi:hypothetical protein
LERKINIRCFFCCLLRLCYMIIFRRKEIFDKINCALRFSFWSAALIISLISLRKWDQIKFPPSSLVISLRLSFAWDPKFFRVSNWFEAMSVSSVKWWFLYHCCSIWNSLLKKVWLRQNCLLIDVLQSVCFFTISLPHFPSYL